MKNWMPEVTEEREEDELDKKKLIINLTLLVVLMVAVAADAYAFLCLMNAIAECFM